MKLSAYKAAHGLEGVLASKATGERLHFRFERGETSVPLVLTIGGFQLEAALELEPSTVDDQVDLRLRLSVTEHPGQVLKASGALAAPVSPSKVISTERVRRVKNTRIEMAEDGYPLTPPGVTNTAPEAAPGVESDEAMGPRTPTSPMAFRSIPDPAATVLDGTDPVSGAPVSRVNVTPRDVKIPDHDDVAAVDHDATVRPKPVETPKLAAPGADHVTPEDVKLPDHDTTPPVAEAKPVETKPAETKSSPRGKGRNK